MAKALSLSMNFGRSFSVNSSYLKLALHSMRKSCLFPSLLIVLLATTATRVTAQDFSNKGKEFWLVFPSHVPSSGLANMALFITSDKNSKGTITANGFSTTFIVTANQITGPIAIPYSNAYVSDAESGTVVNKGIHVIVDPGQPPVVVFAHIYAGFRSEASLILPITTLGKKYYSSNYYQLSTSGSKSQFEIVATEDNTVVQYQLRRNGVLNPTVSTVTLNNPGDVFQVQDVQDLSGSVIESIASGTGSCKRIAVFSGSSAVAIGRAGCSPSSYDPLYQQCYPVNSWGKNFGIVPLANNSSGFHVRVTASENNTTVNFNGTNITLNAGEYYPASTSAATPYVAAMTISADKPISVAQYLMSANCSGSAPILGNGNAQGDPEMIILNPVEQSINDISIFSSNLQAIHTKFLCVYMKTTAAPSFKINGAAPINAFTAMPSGNGYSYLVEDLTNYSTQFFRLKADSGFNAITYGMGDAESYGYSAGTNVKDLYQFVSINNGYATVDFPVACKGLPFTFSMTFPYQPTQIQWQFNGLFPDVTINSPTFTSSYVVNGRTLYKYDLTGSYSIPNVGTYPIRVVAQNPTTDGCSGVQEIDYDLEVFGLPVADFNFATNGCVSSAVSFTDNSSGTNGRPIVHWHWNFGDNNVANDVTSTTHTYAAPGSYNVKYTVITDVGCKADTMIHAVALSDPPVAAFTPSTPRCAGRTVTFTDNSTIASGAISKWYWNFGDGPTTMFTTGTQTHSYAAVGTYRVKLYVESGLGCMSIVDSMDITVSPNPVVNFTLPGNVCLPAGTAQFNSTSTISDGSEGQFNYVWYFGDATAAVGGPGTTHNYAATGPYDIKLVIISNNGCADSLTRQLTTIFAEPQATFTAPPEVCVGSSFSFSDQSTAPGSTISEYHWDFGDLTSSTLQNPTKSYATPGTYTVTLTVTSAAGCQTISSSHIATRQIVVNPLPSANFNTSLPGCIGQGVTFTDASAANAGTIVKWTWDYGDATNAILNSGAAFVHTYSGINSYNVTLKVETDKGCISTLVPKTITINPVPDAGFIAPIICVNDALAPFTDTSHGSVTAWQWNFGDGSATPGNPNTSVIQNPTHHYTVAGTYTAQLIATNNFGCKDTTSNTVTVNGGILTPNFTVQNTAALCSNKSISIKDASSIDAGNILKVEIFWDYTGDPTNKITDNGPTPGKLYSHTYPEFGTPVSKTYTVRYVVYSGITCSVFFDKQLTLLATPQLAVNAALPACTNSPSFQLSAQLQNALPGSGIYSGTGTSPTGNFDPKTAGAGSHNIVYTYTGDNGCASSISQTVIINPTPVADAGPDKTVLEGGYVVMSPTLVTGIPVTYTWSPATYLNDAAIAKPQASPPADFTYTLTVTSDKGCTTSDDVFIKLLKDLTIPNIFSPNGDGVHDTWVIEHLDSYPGCVVQIYNRYGQLVQRYVNYTTPWDGRINGREAPVGTYYYIIDPKNGRKPRTGFVDIIR
ncbi:MAG: PKD domain-containing protein [Bacteroidetes bacterium]|nr:MAG: PKD domain-containing protein [Bacteroidota bacterium]